MDTYDYHPLMDLEEENDRLRKALREYSLLFEKLDEAMASEEQVRQDTELVGGFVSGLNIVCTAEDIVERACRMLKSKSTVTAPPMQEAVSPEGGPA